MIIAIILFAVFVLVVSVGVGCVFVWGALCPPVAPPVSEPTDNCPLPTDNCPVGRVAPRAPH